MRGIVWNGDEANLSESIEIRDIRHGEVRVQVVNAGLCHSDVSVLNKTIMFPAPAVLGHEGAGIVTEVADGIEHLQAGDHVVLTTLGNCGHCGACASGTPTYCRSSIGKLSRPYEVEGEKAFQFANAGVFADETIVKSTSAIRIDSDVPFASACLIGCGVLTGVGAVLNRARVAHGESAVVIGVGGIGLNVVQGLALAGGLPIVAVDTNPDKEDIARQFGATEFICPSQEDDLVGLIKELLPNGAKHVFECVGSTALISVGTKMLDFGGQLVMVGVPKMGTEASFVVSEMYNDKSIMGCRYGSSNPAVDVPLMVRLYKEGRLRLDELVSQTYPLEDFDSALGELHEGKLARGVLSISS